MASNAEGLFILAVAEHFAPSAHFGVKVLLAWQLIGIVAQLDRDAVSVLEEPKQTSDHGGAPLHVLVISGTLKPLAEHRVVPGEVHFDDDQFAASGQGH